MTPRPHEASVWLRGAVMSALQTVVADLDAQTCPHPKEKSTSCLSLHDQRLRCAGCAATYAARLRALDPAEDHTCDRCRIQAPSLTPIVLDLGALLVALGLCPACMDREGWPSHAAR